MRTATVWLALLAAVAAADAQKSSTEIPEVKPIKVSTLIKGALEHTPEELRALALGGLTSARKKQLGAAIAALKADQLPLAQELWAAFVTDLVAQVRADGINGKLLVTIQTAGFAAPGASTNLAEGDADLIQAAFGLPAGSLKSNSSLGPIIQHALADAYMSPNADLTRYAEEISLLARPIRERLKHGYAIQAQLDPDDLEVSWQKAQTDEADFLASLGMPDQIPPEGVQTPEELDEVLEAWDEQLQTIGDDAQLANLDMQNMLQKQQQTMQMMSQISKMLHDTAMAVIRTMGG